jgi:hypothetical protein
MLKHEIHLSKIHKFSLSVTENTMRPHYKDKSVDAEA